MGKGGGGAPQPTSQTVNQTNLPEYARPYFEDLMKRGQEASQVQYQPYQGERVAGFTPMQQQGFQGIQNLGVSPLLQPAAGMTGAAGLGGLFAGQNYAQQATSPGSMQAYMSPYMQNVVDWQKQQAIADYGRQLPGMQAAATNAGAFGGSRQAIVASEAQRNLQNQLAGIQAQGSQSAFDQARQAQQFGSQLGLQGLGLAGQMGQQFGQLGQTAFGQQATAAQAQQQAGATQQAQQQDILNKRYEDFMQQTTYPQSQLQFYSSLLRGVPVAPQQTMYQYQAAPSMASQIGGLGLGALGISKAFSAKDGGEVPGYANGGITGGGENQPTTLEVSNIRTALLKGEDPHKFPPSTALLLALSDPRVEEAIQLRQGAKIQQALDQGRQAPQRPSILEERMAQLDNAGLAGLEIPEETFAAAGGGIVAFDKGGNPSFETYIDRLLAREGGYSDRPEDRGGATNFGISSRAHPDVDVKNLTREDAKKLYRERYWNRLNADELPEPIRERVFDTAVHSGVDTARRLLQQSGGDPETFDALRRSMLHGVVQRDPTQKVFERGWNNRLTQLAAAPGVASDAPPIGAPQYGLAATPEGREIESGISAPPGYVPPGRGRALSPLSALRQGVAGQLPSPAGQLPSPAAANFYVDPQGNVRSSLNQRTPNLPAVRQGTAVVPATPGAVAAGDSGLGTLRTPQGLSYQSAVNAGRMLDVAKNVGRGAVSPGGIATSLALASNEAGAQSDVVPIYKGTSVQDVEDRGDRSGNAVSDVIASWQADADKVYASELALRQKREDYRNAKGRDKKAALQEYQTASMEHDALVKQVRETDAKTGRGAIVEKFLPAVAGGQLTPGQSIVPPVSPLAQQNIQPAAMATRKPSAAGAGTISGITQDIEDAEQGARLKDVTSPDTRLQDKAAESVGINLKDLIPKYDSSEYEKNVKDLQNQAKEALKERDIGRWLAVATAGFAMAAGQSRNALTNIAVGAGIGAKEAREVQKEYGARNDLIQKQLREENRLERAYKLDNQKMILDTTIRIRDLESMIAYRNREGQIKSLEGLLVEAMKRKDKSAAEEIKKVMSELYTTKAEAAADAKSPARVIEQLKNMKKPGAETSSLVPGADGVLEYRPK